MYGICNLSIIPVRLEPSDRSEMVTQLLFGDLYLVVGQNEKWLRIKTAYDGYDGWIDAIQYYKVDKQYFDDYLGTNHPVLNTFSTLATIGNDFFPIVLGSILPFYKEGTIWIGDRPVQVGYNEKNKRNLIDSAFLYFNSPYLWGGKTPFGIDCSGLTQQVFKLQGFRMPRDAYQQAEIGTDIALNDSAPGDLAFFKNDKDKIVHVGIVLPNEKIIHAHGKVRADKLTEQGIWNDDRDVYSHKLAFLKRVG